MSHIPLDSKFVVSRQRREMYHESNCVAISPVKSLCIFLSGRELVHHVSFLKIYVMLLIHQQEYLEKARSYIQNSSEATVSVDDMKGIWLSSDDDQVIFDVKESFAEFFPNVEPERVIWISGRPSETTDASSSNGIPTRVQGMVSQGGCPEIVGASNAESRKNMYYQNTFFSYLYVF